MNEVKQLANIAADEIGSDILLLNSPLMPGADEGVRAVVGSHQSTRQTVVLVLVSSGGLPDVAYRIAMTLRQRYERITICIPGWCKSAGTLLAISGNEILMGSRGEMGPLDVQIAKRDELGGDRDSGLVINEALARLSAESFELFSSFMLSLIAQSSNLVTLRTAADIAAQLTIGLMSPIFEKIDPMRMGADARAMNIGHEYAQRLNVGGQNLRGSDALSMLLNGYPSHSFVIDIVEAGKLFTNVKLLEGSLARVIDALGQLAVQPSNESVICFLEDDNGEANDTESVAEQLLDENSEPELQPHDRPAEDLRRDHQEVVGSEGQSG